MGKILVGTGVGKAFCAGGDVVSESYALYFVVQTRLIAFIVNNVKVLSKTPKRTRPARRLLISSAASMYFTHLRCVFLYPYPCGRFELDYMLATLPKPYIAVMDGVTSAYHNVTQLNDDLQ